MPGATYNGNQSTFNPAVAFAVTEAVDTDPQAAATYEVGWIRKVVDAVEYFRQKAARINAANVFTAAQEFAAGVLVSGGNVVLSLGYISANYAIFSTNGTAAIAGSAPRTPTIPLGVLPADLVPVAWANVANAGAAVLLWGVNIRDVTYIGPGAVDVILNVLLTHVSVQVTIQNNSADVSCAVTVTTDGAGHTLIHVYTDAGGSPSNKDFFIEVKGS